MWTLLALICLSLALLGIAGLQFTYLFYLDRIHKERKKLILKLESECRRLTTRLREAEARITEQDEILLKIYPETSEEVWADVIDER